MKYLMIMLLALFTGLSAAKEPAPFTPEQEKQIEALIQEALFNDPASPRIGAGEGDADARQFYGLQLPVLQAARSVAGEDRAKVSAGRGSD
ncbi:Uncharacterised protein [Citrobacter koseri]|nr:Uncharacterised protein [Citrobacter koseri]